MVGWEATSEALSALQMAAAGSISGAVTRALCQPLDVLKIRFQLQTEPLRVTSGSKYSSMLQASVLIAREEGVAALWSGHVPAQLLSLSYGLVQFVSYEKLTESCYKTEPELSRRYRHGLNFACGAVAAGAATVLSFPLDTIRTRLIAEQKTRRVYGGVYATFDHMCRSEGLRALYKGLFPTLASIAPHAGLQFTVYHFFTDSVFNRISFFQRSVDVAQTAERTLLANLISGGVAGLVAKMAIYPLDLVKKRLQIQGFQQYRMGFGRQFYCGGFTDCVGLIVRQEGLRALYKGVTPSVAKAVLTTSLHFAVYDEIKHYFKTKR